MATDWWPSEERAIFEDAAFILPCYPEDTIPEGSCVKAGTTSAGRITVKVSTALGDAGGVALRAGDTGVPQAIPVLFYGAVKMLTSNGTANVTMFKMVMNSITTSVTPCTNIGTWEITDSAAFAGASHILGMALQASTATGDEIVILVGKCM